MSKPIGYYAAHTPGDGTYFDELETQYGSMLEKMNRRQKLYLIMTIAAELSSQCPDEDVTVCEVSHIPAKVNELVSTSDAEGLIEFLINQVRNEKRRIPFTNKFI